MHLCREYVCPGRYTRMLSNAKLHEHAKALGRHRQRVDAVQAKVVVQVRQSCSIAVCQHHVCHALPCQDAAKEACAAAQLEAAFACKA